MDFLFSSVFAESGCHLVRFYFALVLDIHYCLEGIWVSSSDTSKSLIAWYIKDFSNAVQTFKRKTYLTELAVLFSKYAKQLNAVTISFICSDVCN